jgi:hypothetical protein
LLLIGRDRVLVGLLVGQPLLIAFLINLSQFNPGDRHLNPMYTFAVVASIWLGLNNTAREIVRDRSIYVRERRASVSPESYLLAKVVVFAGIGLLQIALLVLVLRYGTFLGEKRDAETLDLLRELSLVRFTGVLWITYLSSMLLGLVISTLAPTQEVAVAVLPLVILPQLLLTGLATDLFIKPGGWFNALDILIDKASSVTRGAAGWLLEGLSLATYSRPALVFFLEFSDNDRSRLSPPWGDVVRWSHLVLMLLLTGTVFVAVFLRRERGWLQRA